MRLLVVGAGATGGTYGALASRGGADVTLLARGAHAAAMSERGLTVERPGERFNVRLRVVTDLAALAGETFDLVLVTVKAPDLPPLLPRVADLGGTVATAQNGVDAEPLAAAYVPPARLVAVVLRLSASLPEPGRVAIAGKDSFVVGPVDPLSEPAAREAAAALAALGIEVSYRADVLVAKWAKLVWNNAWNVLCALTDRTIAAVANDLELRALAERMMGEVVAVARAEGVELSHDIIPETVARALTVGDIAPSTLQDVRAGRPLEFEALAGTIVRRGRAHRLATPVNDLLYPLLRGRSRGMP